MNEHRSRHGSRLVLATVLTTAAFLLAACGSSGSATSTSTTGAASTASAAPGVGSPSAAIIAQAKSEGTVVWYAGFGATDLTPIGNAFTKQYGIKVQIVAQPSGELEPKVSAAEQSGSEQADVLTAPYSPFFTTGFASGVVKPITASLPGIASTYPASAFSDNGKFAANTIIPVLMAYNSNDIPAADLPKTYADLGKPYFKGKIAAFDPSLSIGGVEFYDAILRKYGQSTLNAIGSNMIKFYSSPAAVLQAVASGEQPITISATAGAVAALTNSGAPLKTIAPPFQVVTEFGSAETGHAPHPAAAKLLLSWIYSSAGQEAINQVELSGSPLQPESLPASFDPGDPASAVKNKTMILSVLHA